MFYKFLLVCLVISTQFSLSQSQKGDTTDLDYFYQNLFDSTLTESEFLENINGFVGSIKNSAKDVDRWHSGQTDYAEVFYQDSIQTINSQRHFNSFRSPVYCSQLLYKGKVIREAFSGGEDMYEARAQLRISESYHDEKRSKRRRRESKRGEKPIERSDTVSVVHEVVMSPVERYYTETYYHHERMMSVRFVVEADSREIASLYEYSLIRDEALNFKRKFTRLISVSYQQLSAEDLPQTPVRHR
ncbi:MAG: hypothetical protein AB8B56_17020 [Crocinitomicaceae bacterium]